MDYGYFNTLPTDIKNLTKGYYYPGVVVKKTEDEITILIDIAEMTIFFPPLKNNASLQREIKNVLNDLAKQSGFEYLADSILFSVSTGHLDIVNGSFGLYCNNLLQRKLITAFEDIVGVNMEIPETKDNEVITDLAIIVTDYLSLEIPPTNESASVIQDFKNSIGSNKLELIGNHVLERKNGDIILVTESGINVLFRESGKKALFKTLRTHVKIPQTWIGAGDDFDG